MQMKVPLPVSSQKPLDVLIVGAGWAGLGAANCLNEMNVENFRIVEGRDYVGGRSRSITLNDGSTRAELGSQWIQGAEESNPIYKVTLQSGTDFVRCSDDWYHGVYHMEGGERMTELEHNKLVEDLFVGPDGFVDYQASRQDQGKKDRPLREIANQYIDAKGMNSEDRRAFEWMLDAFIVQEYAANLEDLSKWWWDDDEELDGGEIYLAQNSDSGYTNVVEHYAMPVKDKILLQSQVSSIDWSSSPAKIQVVDQSASECNFLAKHVVVTVPLGCLKNNTITFVPNLPKDKLKAIDKLGMGLLNKCTLLWDETDELPWPKDKEWIECIAPNNELQGKWTEFHNPMPLNGCPMLYAFSAGRQAQLAEGQSDDAIKEDVMEVLSSIFGDVPEPRQVVTTKWGEDKFSLGSYSFNQVGSDPEHRRALARPVDNKLYFAGEATNAEHFGTTQGALLSGIRAAKKIESQLKRQRRSET